MTQIEVFGLFIKNTEPLDGAKTGHSSRPSAKGMRSGKVSRTGRESFYPSEGWFSNLPGSKTGPIVHSFFVRDAGRHCVNIRWYGKLLIVFSMSWLPFEGTIGGFVQAEEQVSVQKEDLAARQQYLLELMLKKPDDLDIAFEYATVAARNGDYEAAIGTFERMLIYAPGLPRVQLELGVLYYRLGSFDAARNYFESALKSPGVPVEVEARVKTFLAAIVEQEDPAEFRARIIAGTRVQSNANAAPGSRRVTLNGTSFLLDDTATGRADWNGFLAASVHAGYDLGAQGDLLEADLTLFGARYAQVSRLDTAFAELTAGPSFNLKRLGLSNGRAGIFAILSGVRLNHANYLGSLGAGARLSYQPAPDVTVSGLVEFRRRWYNDTAEFSTVSQRNGSQYRTVFTVTKQISGAFSARVTLLGDYEEAKENWNQSWEAGLGVGATYRFESPIEAFPYTWSIDLEGGYIRRAFDAPDPAVNSALSQRDNEGWLRATLSVPLRQDLAMGLTGELRRLQSNYSISTYNNASAMVSVMKVF